MRKYHIVAKKGLCTSDITLELENKEHWFADLVYKLSAFDVEMDDVVLLERKG
jgi:hypothetical protein